MHAGALHLGRVLPSVPNWLPISSLGTLVLCKDLLRTFTVVDVPCHLVPHASVKAAGDDADWPEFHARSLRHRSRTCTYIHHHARTSTGNEHIKVNFIAGVI